MKKKYNYILILISFIMFSQHSLSINNKIIVENFDKSIQLTESQFTEWLNYNKKIQLQDRKTQIETFFIHKLLFSKRTELLKNKNLKIDFYHEISKFNLAEKYYKNEALNETIIDSKAIDKEFEALKNKQDLKSHKVRLYQIYKRYPSNPTEKDKQIILKEMESLREQIHSLDDFKRIAIAKSNSQSRLQKGLIGNIHKGKFDPKIDAIVMQLKKDEMSQVIDVPSGLVLFYCEKIVHPKNKSDKKLREIANKRFKLSFTDNKWIETRKKIRSELKIKFDWDKIKSKGNNQSVIVQSELTQLTKQQLLWIMNPYHLNNSLQAFTNEQIKTNVQNLFINKIIFQKLDVNSQNKINLEVTNIYNERVNSEVIIKLINPLIREPSELKIEKYYKNHSENYKTPISYDISVLAIDFNDSDRKKKYKKLASIHENIINKKISLDNAIKSYSTIQDKFPNLKTDKIVKKRLNRIFGVRIAHNIIQMKIGNMSDIIETKSGFLWILKLNAILQPELLPLNEIKEHIKDEIVNEQINDLQLKIMNDLLETQKINIH